MSSNLDKWTTWFAGVTIDTPQLFGDETTYGYGAEWLKSCDVVVDWGCGKGGFKQFYLAANPRGHYVGIDGSQTPFADVITDLVHYTFTSEGIFMRHVLEHDYQWEAILRNALSSFRKRMVLVLFTPMQDVTREIEWNDDPGVPDIGFNLGQLVGIFEEYDVAADWETYSTNTQRDEETVFYLEKRQL